MYFPPYEQGLQFVSRSPKEDPAQPVTTIPTKLFDFLLQSDQTTTDFSNESYSRQGANIVADTKQGGILAVYQHSIGCGYFEGRNGGIVLVDEGCYLSNYPNLARAVENGAAKSASAHVEIVGVREGQCPSDSCGQVAAQWKNCFELHRFIVAAWLGDQLCRT